jgi:uncharacterized protein YbjT (DUF2867 family)
MEVQDVAINDRVLVVGGTRGTGMVTAQLMLQHQYRVRVLARDPTATAARLGPAIEVVGADITKPDILAGAVEDANHIVFTAGVHSGRYAPESLVWATDYRGVLNTLAAARQTGFASRFLYMNSIGVTTPSLAATLINLLKRNTLVWRRRVKEEIRAAGLDYTIIRLGFLSNAPSNQRKVEVGQGALPLALHRRIGRADVAEAFVAALRHPRASRTTFEIIWGKGPRRENWDVLLDRLKPDKYASSSPQ